MKHLATIFLATILVACSAFADGFGVTPAYVQNVLTNGSSTFTGNLNGNAATATLASNFNGSISLSQVTNITVLTNGLASINYVQTYSDTNGAAWSAYVNSTNWVGSEGYYIPYISGASGPTPLLSSTPFVSYGGSSANIGIGVSHLTSQFTNYIYSYYNGVGIYNDQGQPTNLTVYQINGNLNGNASTATLATNLQGTIPASQVVGALTNNQSGLNLSGSFTGDGSGLTNIPATAIGGETIGFTNSSGAYVLLSTNGSFTAADRFGDIVNFNGNLVSLQDSIGQIIALDPINGGITNQDYFGDQLILAPGGQSGIQLNSAGPFSINYGSTSISGTGNYLLLTGLLALQNQITNAVPVNQSTPVIWVQTYVNGQVYYQPLYQ